MSFFRTVSQISSIASYLAEESLALERKLDSSDPWLPWVFFLGWTSFQGGKDSPRTSELDPIFTFSTFCCHPIRWQGERWSCVAWNDSLATLPRLCIPRGNLDPNRRTRIHLSNSFYLFNSIFFFIQVSSSAIGKFFRNLKDEDPRLWFIFRIPLGIFFLFIQVSFCANGWKIRKNLKDEDYDSSFELF